MFLLDILFLILIYEGNLICPNVVKVGTKVNNLIYSWHSTKNAVYTCILTRYMDSYGTCGIVLHGRWSCNVCFDNYITSETQNSEICLFNPLFFKEIIHASKTLNILQIGYGDIC